MNTDPFISDLMKEFESITSYSTQTRVDDLGELGDVEQLFIKATATLAFNRIPDAYTDHASRDESTSSVWILGALAHMRKNRGNLKRAKLSLRPGLLDNGELFNPENQIKVLCSKLWVEINAEIFKYDAMIVTYNTALWRHNIIEDNSKPLRF